MWFETLPHAHCVVVSNDESTTQYVAKRGGPFRWVAVRVDEDDSVWAVPGTLEELDPVELVVTVLD